MNFATLTQVQFSYKQCCCH